MMRKLMYYIGSGIISLLSHLPMSILYVVADIVYLLLYYFVRYRRKVVSNNLRNSFPDWTQDRVKTVRKAYFKYLADLIVETIKTYRLQPITVKKRITFDPQKVMNRLLDDKRSAILAMGHHGNWEWAGAAFTLAQVHQLYVIYRPLKHPDYDQLIRFMRTRLGTKLYPMKGALRGMVSNRNSLTATAFIADQNPDPNHAHWIDFLNQDTPFFPGLGKVANRFDHPVVYISTKRTKRGYYCITPEVLIEEPSKLHPEEITRIFAYRLRRDIEEQPETWLWSHRRWKHSRSAT